MSPITLPMTTDDAVLASRSRDIESAERRLRFEREEWERRLVAGDVADASEEEYLRVRKPLTDAEAAWEALGQIVP